MGQRKGVSVRHAETPNDLKIYYQLYQDTVDRWGEKANIKYGLSLFEQIWEKLIPKRKAVLWLAEWKGKIISGCLTFYHNKHTVAWHAASDYRLFDLYANQVIHFYIIEDALKQGYEIYDLNPSHGLEGVIKFKEGFGTEKLEFQSYRNYTPLYKIALQMKKLFPGIKN
jgi:lipid II:glycine glycyltransferase (peptidoglycan interpeptide bridge formation enzyme)